MGRVDLSSGAKTPKVKKPKTLIQLKREERKAKKLLPRPPRPAPTPAKVRDPDHVPRPKPKPQNPGFQKWMALFKREITMIETHLKHAERFRQHWRAEIDRMEEPEKSKWESGEVGNFQRLLQMMERSREILVQAREMSAWIVSLIFWRGRVFGGLLMAEQVPKSKLGLNKNLPGMKDFVLGMEEKKKAKGANGEGNASSSDEDDSTDTDTEMSDAAPADFIPLNIVNKAANKSKDAADMAATEPAEPNSFFVVDTEPTPVNLNGKSKKGKKRAKPDEGDETKSAKKAKKENAPTVSPTSEPEPSSASNQQLNPVTADVPIMISQSKPEPASASDVRHKSSKVDLSAIETQLQAEIEAGTKAKEEREKAKAEKLAKKEKRPCPKILRIMIINANDSLRAIQRRMLRNQRRTIRKRKLRRLIPRI
jgi:hypothetical protein